MAQGSSPQAVRKQARRNPASRRLLGAAVLILVGAFLPWLSTGVGNVSGVAGAGLWTMYAALLGLAGAAWRSPRIAAIHAAVLAAVAVPLSLWQVVHVVGLVGFGGWMPGPGLVMTFGGGILAGTAAVTLFRSAQAGADAPQ